MTTCPRCRLKWGQSEEERGLLFAVIGLAFANWPERHKFQPTDAEHLRAWLAIEVGHYEALKVERLDGERLDDIVAMGKFFSNGRKDFRLVGVDGGLELRRPRTMKKDLPIKEFRPMATKIYELLEDVTGVSPEVYKVNKDRSHEPSRISAKGPQAGLGTSQGMLRALRQPDQAG